jgi:hypothetical protein
MKKSLILLLVLSLFLSVQKSYSQNEKDTTKLFRIESIDGNEYLGYIIEQNSSSIRLKTSNIGVITLLLKDIKKQVEVKKEEIKDGRIWYENLQSTRYFWAPNGYGLQKGEAYYQNLWIFYNQYGYGFTNNFSMGVGLMPLFFFNGSPFPIWFVPKFSIPIVQNKINLGFGILAAKVIGGFEGDISFGIAYGVSTFGSRDYNISLGAGYGYFGSEWAKRPLILVGTMLRTGKKGYLMTENYFIQGGNSFLSMVGGRSLIRKTALDYGLFIPWGSHAAIPWLGITIPIESK